MFWNIRWWCWNSRSKRLFVLKMFAHANWMIISFCRVRFILWFAFQFSQSVCLFMFWFCLTIMARLKYVFHCLRACVHVCIAGMCQSYISRFLRGEYFDMSGRSRLAIIRWYLAYKSRPNCIGTCPTHVMMTSSSQYFASRDTSTLSCSVHSYM